MRVSANRRSRSRAAYGRNDITKSLKNLVNFLFLSETHAKHKMSIIDGFITYKDEVFGVY